MLEPETNRLERLEQGYERIDRRVGSPERLEQATAEVLVEALKRAEVARHRELARAIAPVVVAAIQTEIRNSRDMMVEALYPITGRLVSAAVANAFRELVASTNQRVDALLSIRQWRWRLKSWTSGRSISEIALAETARPVLQRLLLLERKSGVLLGSWARDPEQMQNADLVSGLIAAITEFASSVFEAQNGELRTLDLGMNKIIMRASPQFIIAGEVTGVMSAADEREADTAFLRYMNELRIGENISGSQVEQVALSIFRDDLSTPRKGGIGFWVVAAAVGAVLLFFGGRSLMHWNVERNALAAVHDNMARTPQLAAFPITLDFDHATRAITLRGLSSDAGATKTLAGAVQAATSGYTVTTNVQTVALLAQSEQQQQDTIERLHTEETKAAERIATLQRQLAELQSALTAAQNAGRADTQSVSQRLSETQTTTAQELAAIKAQLNTPRARLFAAIAGRSIFFKTGEATTDDPSAEAVIAAIVPVLRETGLAIRVVGYADQTGTVAINRRIAQGRAEFVTKLFQQAGIPTRQLFLTSRAYSPIAADKAQDQDRRVAFEMLNASDEAR
ncbi:MULTISPECIES: OmpA family protein [unclassified Beijerinckia]|uniref:OmpA family protein n=1 Tax=unclassified Beijerinckia TaxID=2638183 RepID=UPI001114757E|nr:MULTISPECIES: OmpA family protein [unclassified Beijerinckia]